MPIAHRLGIVDATRRNIVAERRSGTRGKCAGLVGQHKSVFTLHGVIEVIKDSVFFHQAGYEIKRRLAVLNAVLKSGIASFKAGTKIFEAEKIQHLADDVRRSHVLEDAAIRLASEKPQPGHDLRVIVGKHAVIGIALRETADVTIDVAGSTVRQLHCDADFLTDDILK